MQPSLSPDGTKLAFTRAATGTADVWLHDIGSGATTQVTTDPDYDESPVWSPDGKALAHQGQLGEVEGLVLTTIDGSRPPRSIMPGPGGMTGRFMPTMPSVIVSIGTDSGGTDLSIVPLGQPHAAQALTKDPGVEGQPSPSPNGQWLAFVTDRSGRAEVVLARLIQEGAALHCKRL